MPPPSPTVQLEVLDGVMWFRVQVPPDNLVQPVDLLAEMAFGTDFVPRLEHFPRDEFPVPPPAAV